MANVGLMVFYRMANTAEEVSRLLHSSFSDAHQGQKFTITFYSHENGFTAELKVDGLPAIKDGDRLWADREDAKVDLINEAHRLISSQR